MEEESWDSISLLVLSFFINPIGASDQAWRTVVTISDARLGTVIVHYPVDLDKECVLRCFIESRVG